MNWTQEIPDKAAWFWVFRKGMQFPKLVQVFFMDGAKRYSFYESPHSSSKLTPESFTHYCETQDPPRKPEWNTAMGRPAECVAKNIQLPLVANLSWE